MSATKRQVPGHFGAFDVPFATLTAQGFASRDCVDTMLVAYLADEKAKTRPEADLKALAAEVLSEFLHEKEVPDAP